MNKSPLATLLAATALVGGVGGGAVEVELPRSQPLGTRLPYPAEQPRQPSTTHGPRPKRNRKAQRASKARKGRFA